ncbi:hypothetical protein [Microbacterium sp. NPDC056052]|uniref:hypothetical protein n=1 Tax=Microbacterium sp. NPDC056052 TaxID=3345695 RepID=UPI0035D98D8D
MTDPVARVEADAPQRCDAQGVATYPDGYAAHRTPEATTASWDGDRYRLGYPATVIVPGPSVDAPPVSKVVVVTCTLTFENDRVVVAGWAAA